MNPKAPLFVIGLCIALCLSTTPAMSGDYQVGDFPEGYWDLTGDERIPLIRQMIEEKGLCWQAGPTSMSNLTDEEKQRRLGVDDRFAVPAPPDPFENTRGDRLLPAYFDWREQLMVTTADNQGNCGSCWIFGPTAVVESAILIYDHQRFDISEQQVLSCVSSGWGCSGGQMYLAYNHYRDYGTITKECMPYWADDTRPCTQSQCEVIASIDAFYSVSNTATAIKNAVYDYGPISSGIYVFDDFNYYNSGCYTNQTSHSTNHCILICGWDDDQCDGNGAWLIKNSWGHVWGEDGFAWVEYGVAGIGRSSQRVAYTPQLHLLESAGYSVDAAKGNGDGFLDPGETGELILNLTNDGMAAATGVTGILRAVTPGVTVLDSIAGFSDVPSGGSAATVAPHFEVTVGGGFTGGDWIEFELQVGTATQSKTLGYVVYVGPHTEVLMDDFETDQGWTVGAADDDATEGIWERTTPNLKLTLRYTGDAAQLGEDATPAPGTMCFVTENSPLGTKMRFGDVDGGKTTLISPVVDLSPYSRATLTYKRWYNNDTLGEDGDPFEVDVSNDGGSSWTNLEVLTETPEDREFHRVVIDLTSHIILNSQVQVRFVAQDIGPNNSVVEALIDDVEIRGFGYPTSVAEETGEIPVRKPATLTLGQNIPNPFNPETVISFGLPNGSNADLSIYNIHGQKVRQIAGGWMHAGFHRATWDGMDGSGRHVSSGVYFYRLTTPEGIETRRMTLVK